MSQELDKQEKLQEATLHLLEAEHRVQQPARACGRCSKQLVLLSEQLERCATLHMTKSLSAKMREGSEQEIEITIVLNHSCPRRRRWREFSADDSGLAGVRGGQEKNWQTRREHTRRLHARAVASHASRCQPSGQRTRRSGTQDHLPLLAGRHAACDSSNEVRWTNAHRTTSRNGPKDCTLWQIWNGDRASSIYHGTSSAEHLARVVRGAPGASVPGRSTVVQSAFSRICF